MLITHATVITWGDPCQILTDHALYVDDGVIQAMAPSHVLIAHYPDVERLDAHGQLVMAGNICAHTHFYGAYARGLAIPGEAPADFPQILSRLWWCLDRALDADSVRLSALVMAIDAIRHGTTTLFDHHASPNFITGSLDVIASVLEQAGLRGVLCYEVTDRNGMDDMHMGIAENVRFIHAMRQHPLLRGTFGLHASLTLNDDSLRACADAVPDDVGVHIHVAEHEADEMDSVRRSKQRVVQRLDAFGMWRENAIAAHCVHIDEAERRLLAERGVWVTHQARSNMNNAVGAAPIEAMLQDGIRVCLGTDGFSHAMWSEWKTAYLLHKLAHRDPRRANGMDIARMATQFNAALTRQFFPEAPIGVLQVGAKADLILVDYHPFTPMTADNIAWHILFGFESSMVTGTIVQGRVLMRDRQLLTLDEQAIYAEALAYAPRVWEQFRRFAQTMI